jgi:crotonobetainyl-CoA:carnitine CoA-transferase CaiB-like acyl-CoA transferase
LSWEQALSKVGVPAARILTVPQAVELAQLAHRGFLAEVPFPGEASADAPTAAANADADLATVGHGERRLRLSGTGVLVNGHPLHPTEAPPRLGEHNAQLAEIMHRWRTSRPAVGPPVGTVGSVGSVEAASRLQLSQ